jgi:hypothetical protein
MTAGITDEPSGAGRPWQLHAAPGWLSIRQAAEHAGLSEKMIRRAIHAREESERLRAFDVGSGRKSCWRIAAADLEVWMRRKEGGATLPPPRTYRGRPGPSRHFRF